LERVTQNSDQIDDFTYFSLSAIICQAAQIFWKFFDSLEQKKFQFCLLSGSTKKRLKFSVLLLACLHRIKVNFKDLIMHQQTKVISAQMDCNVIKMNKLDVKTRLIIIKFEGLL
jgi:hypothetical protein